MREKGGKEFSYPLTSPTCTFIVVNILYNQHILSLQIFDPAHVCTDKTVTLQSLSALESRKRTIRRFTQPLCPDISMPESLIPACRHPICPVVSLPVGTRSSGPVEAIKALV